MPIRGLAFSIVALLGLSGPAAAQHAEAVFAGGCFWGVQWVFEHVRESPPWFPDTAAALSPIPRYELVGTGTTGHAESVRVTYDPRWYRIANCSRSSFWSRMTRRRAIVRDRMSGSDYRAIVFARDSAQLREVSAYRRRAYVAARVQQADRDRAPPAPAVLHGRSLSPAFCGYSPE